MSAELTATAVRTSTGWPLTSPFAEFDAGMATCPAELPVTTLLANDDGWEWMEEHPAELVAAAHQLIAVARSEEWTAAEFAAAGVRLTLATRGRADCGRVHTAVLHVAV